MAIDSATDRAVPASAPRDVDPSRLAPTLATSPILVASASGVARVHDESFALHTRGVAPAFFDLTGLVQDAVARSGVAHGLALAGSAHTTCALIVQENETLLLADLAERLCRFAHPDEPYRHNRMDVRTVNVCGPEECANGHSHCQHALLGASVTLPVRDGTLVLGRWQRLLLGEVDHPRPRPVTVSVQGIGRDPNR